MLASMLPYARGLGVDARWLVIAGDHDFFRVTKRLHNMLHGYPGDDGDLGEPERALYERTAEDNFEELAALVRAGDVVILHDPQTAGLVSRLKSLGALVIWRSHIGTSRINDSTILGWSFLLPYLAQADAYVFSREGHRPAQLSAERSAIIPPSIDPFSAKNQELPIDNVKAILRHIGILGGSGSSSPLFHHNDGTPARVDRRADVIRLGPPPSPETPLLVQVSRWDELKDPIGVLDGFSKLVSGQAPGEPQLVLAGPSVAAVADDPEGSRVFDEVLSAWRALPHSERQHVTLGCLPMADSEENAAMVNALQRHATVIIQKSLEEGFGLTVTEAMWKGRPVVASRVGGIMDQIEHRRTGLLVDPTNRDEFVTTLRRLLKDPALGEELGRNARERVAKSYLHIHHLAAYGRLLARLLAQ
jgi:trehalose synthase